MKYTKQEEEEASSCFSFYIFSYNKLALYFLLCNKDEKKEEKNRIRRRSFQTQLVTNWKRHTIKKTKLCIYYLAKISKKVNKSLWDE